MLARTSGDCYSPEYYEAVQGYYGLCYRGVHYQRSYYDDWLPKALLKSNKQILHIINLDRKQLTTAPGCWCMRFQFVTHHPSVMAALSLSDQAV